MHGARPGGALRSVHGLALLIRQSTKTRRLLAAGVLLAAPALLVGAALLPQNALLPADLLVQFEPWRSRLPAPPAVHWDPLLWDGIAQYYPWRLFAADSLRAGVIPLWNPYQFCGTPFLANGQSAVLYPLNILFWVLPLAQAFAWSAWLHLLLTGWFAYLFLRRIGTGTFGALAAAVVWQLNGFFVAWIHLPTVLCTATWLPLILLCCERALVTGRARRALGAGLALGLSYLGGHPQIFLFLALLSAAYVLFRGLQPGPGLSLPARAARLVATGAISGLTGLALAAAQFLPTIGLLRIAHRTFTAGPESYAAFLSHAIPALQLAGLVIPHAFGHPALGTYVGRDNYAEYAAYVGVIALPLGLWAALACRTWHARFFAAAVLVAVLLALGTPLNWPLYWWVPGVARSGGPARVLLLAAFGLSMLAGIGLDAAARRLAESRPHTRAYLFGLLLATGAAVAIWHSRGTPAVAQVNVGVAPLGRAEAARALTLIAVAFVALQVLGHTSLRRLGQLALLAILAADPLLAARHHIHRVPAAFVYPRFDIAHQVGGRIIANARDWPLNRFPDAVLPPNSATVYHLRDLFGYDSLYLARYRDFAAAVQHGDPSPPLNGNLLLARLAGFYGLDMMSLAAADTVLSPVPLYGLRLERLGAFYTYRNPYARPRTWVAGSAISVPTHTDAVVALARLGPMDDCVLLTGPDGLDAPTVSGRPSATVRDISPNEMQIAIQGGGGGYLFIADAYAPGWRAYAGERELPIRPAYVAFRAVPLPPDARSVTLRYEPASLRVGLFIMLVALGAAGAAGACTLAVRGASW